MMFKAQFDLGLGLGLGTYAKTPFDRDIQFLFLKVDSLQFQSCHFFRLMISLLSSNQIQFYDDSNFQYDLVRTVNVLLKGD